VTTPLADPDDLPDWLARLAAGLVTPDFSALRRGRTAPPDARQAAVLMLFGDTPDLLLLRRADTLGSHPGQVAFPGGGADPGEESPVATALREAEEEVGLLADGVRPVAVLPKLYVPVSGFQVSPVLAWWERPSPVRAVNSAETAAVARVPISMLTDPARRIMVRHPSGFSSPGYLLPGMLVWGFTAGLVTMLLRAGGWDRPWDRGDVRDLDQALRAAGTVRAAGVDTDEEAS
jgi:8-oxo-dGTP pyrophosphatase MutT (NUDIX family)